ncbi:response regulator [Thermodesulfobacteriota bacterium]
MNFLQDLLFLQQVLQKCLHDLTCTANHGKQADTDSKLLFRGCCRNTRGYAEDGVVITTIVGDVMKNLKILVVDDDKTIRALLEKKLTKMGHAIIVAENGSQAIDRLVENTFDLVLTDLKMPGIDGIGVLEAVKQKNDLTQVIMVTAYASLDTAIQAMQIGAADYLNKPINFDELSMRLDKIIHDKEQREILRQAEKNKEQAMQDLEEVAAVLRLKFNRIKKALSKNKLPAEERIAAALEILK